MKNSNQSQTPQRYVQFSEWIGIHVAAVKNLIEFHEGEFVLLTETDGSLEEATVTRDGISFSLRDLKEEYDVGFKVFAEQENEFTTLKQSKHYQYRCGECSLIWIPSKGTSCCPVCGSDVLTRA